MNVKSQTYLKDKSYETNNHFLKRKETTDRYVYIYIVREYVFGAGNYLLQIYNIWVKPNNENICIK